VPGSARVRAPLRGATGRCSIAWEARTCTARIHALRIPVRADAGVATIAVMDSHLTRAADVVEDCGGLDNRQLAECLHRVAAGDRVGFEMLYRLTSARLWSVIRRMVARKQAAEDVLQDTYLTIWRKAHLFDSTAGEALGWMTTIARHRAIEWLRQPGNATPRTSNETSASEEVSAGDITERSVLYDQLLSSLSAEQRESLLLIYFHGMTQEEVSTALDVPLGTIKSRVRRGLIALKEVLDS